MKRARSALIASACIVVLGACASTEKTTAEPTDALRAEARPTVAIEDFAYDPPRLLVEAGTTVTWVNKDDILHTATSGRPRAQGIPGVTSSDEARPDGLFAGRLSSIDATFSFTFEERGTYRYFCDVHAGMSGRVVVE